MVTRIRPTATANSAIDTRLEMLEGKELHPIYLVGGEKGGVGKTTVSRALCQYLKSRGQKFALVEADSQINDVGRVYHDQATSIETITLDNRPDRRMEPDAILKAATKATTVVNLPSNTLSVLDEWITDTQILGIIDKHCNGQHRLVKWFVSDGCHESIQQLKESIFAMDGSIPHLVVLNHGRINGLGGFSYLNTHADYQLVVEQPNCVAEIEFPALESAIQLEIDSRGLTLEDASASKPVSEKLGLMTGTRIANYCRKFSEVFEQAIKLERSWDLKEANQAYGLDEVEAKDASQVPEEKPTGEQISAGVEGKDSGAEDAPQVPEEKPTGEQISASLQDEDTDATDDSPLPESPGEGFDEEDRG